MDASRFDTISRLFASRRTRRSAIATGMGLAAAGFGAQALAQESTPAASTDAGSGVPHPRAEGATHDPEFLFVQPFEGGTWVPGSEPGLFTLTLSGAAANTVYFSDRPERIVGLSPTDMFLDQLGFTPDNPPNAALVSHTDDGEQDILVIELLNPVYDADSATLTYDARVLADYGNVGLAHLAQQQTNFEHAESFGSGSLFIDDCSDWQIGCFHDGNLVGTYSAGRCYHFPSGCSLCHDPESECADRFAECSECASIDANGNCTSVSYLCKADGV